MINGTGIVGMQEDDVSHRYLLNGTQDNPSLLFVNTQHLVGIDGQQTQAVEVELTLRLVGSEGVAFGETQDFADLALRVDGHIQAVVGGIAIDIDFHRYQSLHIDGLDGIGQGVDEYAVGKVVILIES